MIRTKRLWPVLVAAALALAALGAVAAWPLLGSDQRISAAPVHASDGLTYPI